LFLTSTAKNVNNIFGKVIVIELLSEYNIANPKKMFYNILVVLGALILCHNGPYGYNIYI